MRNSAHDHLAYIIFISFFAPIGPAWQHAADSAAPEGAGVEGGAADTGPLAAAGHAWGQGHVPLHEDDAVVAALHNSIAVRAGLGRNWVRRDALALHAYVARSCFSDLCCQSWLANRETYGLNGRHIHILYVQS